MELLKERKKMEFTSEEKDQILAWYENVKNEQASYGNGAVTFTNEAMLVEKIQSNAQVAFNEYELDMIRDWMNRNIKKKYGQAVYLIGVEQDLYNKLNDQAK
jgi:hypothetical protein